MLQLEIKVIKGKKKKEKKRKHKKKKTSKAHAEANRQKTIIVYFLSASDVWPHLEKQSLNMLWWFYPAGQLSSTLAVLSLPLLKGKPYVFILIDL